MRFSMWNSAGCLKINFLCYAIISLVTFNQAMAQSGYSSAVEARLNDVALTESGKTKVYAQENLTGIRFPVGGVGAGVIQMNGKGEREIWQIFNNFSQAFIPDSFFAVRAQKQGGNAVIRALQTSNAGDFVACDELTFRGEYPMGWYDFVDGQLPVSVSMEVFNPLIPLNTKDSAIPCAIYRITAVNTSSEPVNVSLLATQKNATGFTGYEIPQWSGPADGTVIADFESADFGQWIKTGDAFDSGPMAGTTHSEQVLRNYRGKKLVNTYGDKGDLTTGTLTSPEFVIGKNYIHFLMAGGAHKGKTCVNLLIGDRVVYTDIGRCDDSLEWHSWDVKEFKGQSARIQIVDAVTGEWGHIDCDQFVMSDVYEQPSPKIYGLGLNRNRIRRQCDMTSLVMTTERINSSPGYGSMALTAIGDGVQANAYCNDISGLYKRWHETGIIEGDQQAGISGEGMDINGSLAAPCTLAPGESKTFTFILTWYFPNVTHGVRGDEGTLWHTEGNMYTNFWSDALDVAYYVADNFNRLSTETHLYHDTLYSSNLPHWLLDRITSQVAVVRGKTCFWGKTGFFGGWEGLAWDDGAAPGNCTHVWQYAQAHARLFPELALRMREEMMGQMPASILDYIEGGFPHRYGQIWWTQVAFDGQCGEILSAYREHLNQTDQKWLNEWWTRIRKGTEYLISRYDSDEDGVLAGAQWNTLDGNLSGSTSWMGTLYLATLEAAEKMAVLQEDVNSAEVFKRIRLSGMKKQNETLWNGEYYTQIPDRMRQRDYINGCHIDQLLGEWWASQLGLGPYYPVDRIKQAMTSLVKNNFHTDFNGIIQEPRKFVDEKDAGMQMITWPHNDRPENFMRYSDEVMTGFEYSAAATMVHFGLVKEGYMVVKAVSDRYDGKLRTGLNPSKWAAWGYNGSPFGDDECGKFYTRAMSSWSLLLTSQGYYFNGPEKIIGFDPKWQPEDHASFFTGARAWGLFTQKRNKESQKDIIKVSYGNLEVVEVRLTVAQGSRVGLSGINISGQPVSSELTQDGDKVVIKFEKPVVIGAGNELEIMLDSVSR